MQLFCGGPVTYNLKIFLTGRAEAAAEVVAPWVIYV